MRLLLSIYIILLAKTTATQNEVALLYHKGRGLFFLAAVFVATIIGVNKYIGPGDACYSNNKCRYT